MYVATQAHSFLWFFKVFKIFLVLIISYCLKIWPLICLSLEEMDSLLFTFVVKKSYFPICYTNYLINIFPDFRAFANLGCQLENKLKQLCKFTVKMQNICNLVDWNSIHISGIFNCYNVNTNGMWKTKKTRWDIQNIWIYTSLKHTYVGKG